MEFLTIYLNQAIRLAGQVTRWVQAHAGLVYIVFFILALWLIWEVRRNRKETQRLAEAQMEAAQTASRLASAPYLTATLYSRAAIEAFRKASKPIDAAYRKALQNGANEESIRHLALLRNPSSQIAREVNLILYDSLTQSYYRSLNWGLDLMGVGKEDYLFIEERPLEQAGVFEYCEEVYDVPEGMLSPYLEGGRRSLLFIFFRDTGGRVYLARRQFSDGPQGLQPSFPAEVFFLK